MDEKKGWVLVTGGTRGIGKGIVQALCRAGYPVMFTFKSSDNEAHEVVDMLTTQGFDCAGYRCDIADGAQVGVLADELTALRGAPYAIVNNAGIVRDSLLLNMELSQWSQVISTNINSAYHVIHSFLPSMLLNGDGCIVQMSSVTAFKGNSGQSNYAASKAAMIGMARSLAVELGRFNIRVNTIAPGLISTDMTNDIPEMKMKKLVSEVPLRRVGVVEDISAMVEFLIGSGGRYITGQTFVIDGGLTA